MGEGDVRILWSNWSDVADVVEGVAVKPPPHVSHVSGL